MHKKQLDMCTYIPVQTSIKRRGLGPLTLPKTSAPKGGISEQLYVNIPKHQTIHRKKRVGGCREAFRIRRPLGRACQTSIQLLPDLRILRIPAPHLTPPLPRERTRNVELGSVFRHWASKMPSWSSQDAPRTPSAVFFALPT